MTAQMGGAIALAVMGFLFIVISVISRDGVREGSFGDKLSKAGIMIGALFMLPLIFMVVLGIVIGFP